MHAQLHRVRCTPVSTQFWWGVVYPFLQRHAGFIRCVQPTPNNLPRSQVYKFEVVGRMHEITRALFAYPLHQPGDKWVKEGVGVDLDGNTRCVSFTHDVPMTISYNANLASHNRTLLFTYRVDTTNDLGFPSMR